MGTPQEASPLAGAAQQDHATASNRLCSSVPRMLYREAELPLYLLGSR